MKLLFFLITTSLATAAARKTIAELDTHLQKIAPSLVEATVGILVGGGSGSGVIVSPEGLVITAAHVTVKPNEQMTVYLADGRQLPATSLGVDHTTDGALLQINAPGPFPHRPFIREKNYEVGDWAIATGHPGGPIVGRPAPFRLGRIYQAGTDSGFTDPITTSAMVISGDSGGPLFNLKGEVIGINSNISGAWTVNNHVPLPSIIAVWDQLMAGEHIGEFQQNLGNGVEPDEFFDEPYRSLREKFEATLAERPLDDDEANSLRETPRLLDPHHMQAYLDKWSPDPEALQTPKLGFTLDLSQAGKAIVAEVLAKSPAANAGLKVGDEIVELDAIPITTATSFALALRKISAENPVIITLISGHAVTITPATVPARRHFPAPVAGLIPMMIGNQAATSPPSIRELDRGFLAPLAALKESLKLSVIPIYQNRNLIVYATAVSGNQLLTKYSEIKEKEDLTFRLDEQESSVRLIAFDEKRDLALVSGTLQGLQPVGLQYNEAETGALLLTPLATQLITGVITQPARAVPALGYEHNVSPDDPSGYLGISLSPDEERPTVSSVALGSPADFGGLLEGDRIAQLGKTKVDSVEELSKLLKGYAPGDKVILKVARDNDILEIPLILDFRPATPADRKDRRAEMRDSSLASLTANGGKISQRRAGFPLAIYHDTRLRAQEMGTPLLDAEGKFLGLNIARALRQRTLAIPVNEIRNFFREERSRKSGTD